MTEYGQAPIPEALRRLELATLVGLPVEQARAIVERAGGWLYTTETGHVTFVYDPRRVVAMIRDGQVESATSSLG